MTIYFKLLIFNSDKNEINFEFFYKIFKSFPIDIHENNNLKEINLDILNYSEKELLNYLKQSTSISINFLLWLKNMDKDLQLIENIKNNSAKDYDFIFRLLNFNQVIII